MACQSCSKYVYSETEVVFQEPLGKWNMIAHLAYIYMNSSYCYSLFVSDV